MAPKCPHPLSQIVYVVMIQRLLDGDACENEEEEKYYNCEQRRNDLNGPLESFGVLVLLGESTHSFLHPDQLSLRTDLSINSPG